MWAAAALAQAYPNDVSYAGLAQWQDGCDPYGKTECLPVKDASGRVMGDQRAFDGLAEELGVILAPRDVGPASTGGQSGFDLAVEITGHRINNRHDYWARSLERSARSDSRDVVYPAMGTMQAWLKKGLPYSFQVAAGGTYLLESRIMAVGVQGKWTLNEGFFWFPDVALTAGANKTLCLGLPSSIPLGDERANGTTKNSCANDLDMFTVTAGAVVSKTFAVLGTFTVSPYAGWQKIFVHSFSPFVDGDPTSNDRTGETFKFRDYKVWGDFVGQECGEADVPTARCFTDAQGAPQLLNLVSHRNKLYAGLRVNFSIMEATLQGEMTHIRGTAWDVGTLAFAGDTLRLDGLGMPDLHLGATFRLGLIF
jgi:hypothetical protein